MLEGALQVVHHKRNIVIVSFAKEKDHMKYIDFLLCFFFLVELSIRFNLIHTMIIFELSLSNLMTTRNFASQG